MALLIGVPVPVPFPNAQNLSADITVNGASTLFTINTTGRYLITYVLYPTLSLLTTFQLRLNGTGVNGTQVSAAVGIGIVQNQVIINVTAGNTISVTATAALAGSVTLAAGSTAATISMVRVG
uniref:BclA C-terminal domain-containing protein n=1 Tax=Paenibacillus sabuli TaxID=2772509 RepID=UPI001CC325F3|nr:hypothetical protein [Paenibacillus sabuli]